MGRPNVPSRGPVYVDSSSVIYRVEGLEPHASASLPVREALQEGRCRISTSELTLLEVLVRPIRDGYHGLVEIYRGILANTRGLSMIGIDRTILELAAKFRAEHRLKTPDSIHAATTLQSGTAPFVTNDRDFLRVPGLNVVILEDVASS